MTIATRYKRLEEGRIPRRVVRHHGAGHRNHARKALGEALTPKVVRWAPHPPRSGAEVIVALAFCWAMLGAPTVRARK